MLLNFREVAGQTGQDGGHLRPGMLFRGGAVLDRAAAQSIVDLGVSMVCDLRCQDEEGRHPSALRSMGIAHAAENHAVDLGAPVQLLRQEGATTAASRAAMIEVYRRLPQVFRLPMAQVFAVLADRDDATFVHCAVGKDRTGATIALVLATLGVGRDEIMADYLATNAARDAIADSMQHRHPGVPAEGDPTLLPLLVADPDYLAAFFAEIGPDRSDIEAFVCETLGLGRAGLARLRNRLLV